MAVMFMHAHLARAAAETAARAPGYDMRRASSRTKA